MIKEFLKKVYSYIIFYRKCNLDFGAIILGKSVFEGNNKISRNAFVKNIKIGYGSYIGAGSYICNAKIGRFTSIGDTVKIVDATHPLEPFVSTHPSFYSIGHYFSFVKIKKFNEYLILGDCSVKIGNDVWIGSNVILKGGIEVGYGAIIAMGAVVINNVPAYAIVGGVPAKVIRYRFTVEQRERLIKFRWWDKDIDWINQHSETFSDINTFIKEIKD
jgi:acetyltransferase-like isoleucine patch superfamily enzyme